MTKIRRRKQIFERTVRTVEVFSGQPQPESTSVLERNERRSGFFNSRFIEAEQQVSEDP